MLHELLLSMTGISGTFLERELSSSKDIQLPYFHQSEIVIIKQLMSIASQFRKIKIFKEKYGLYNLDDPTQEKELQQGTYLTAFALASYEETEEYRNAIVALEKDLESPGTSISILLLALEPFEYILSQLSKLIGIIEDHQIHGCKILELVHKMYLNSVGKIRSPLQRILKRLNSVLLDQLSHWLIFGMLVDPHEEFFIQLSKEAISNAEGVSRRTERKRTLDVVHRLGMLPDHIPLNLAEQILFVGESILFFEQEHCHNQDESDSPNSIILQTKEEEFIKVLKNLSSQDSFSMNDFAYAVEEIREYVSRHFCTVVQKGGLGRELQDIKSIFLLGNGELFHAFFNITGSLVGGSIATISCINRLLHRAGHQVLLEESFLEKFHLKMEKHSDSDSDGWEDLQMSYNVKWPLHKIFSPKVQQRYNQIWMFLLNLKRVQYRLQRLWIAQKGGKHSKSEESLKLWTLRHHMNLLIYNLQYYIQVDVLECQFCKLLQDLEQATDYQVLVASHHNFLASLTNQCFLNHHVISTHIQMIVNIIHKFCDFVELSEHDEIMSSSLKDLESQFDRASGNFFWLLTAMGQQKSTQHAAQLIMRIDYNEYYSEKTPAKRLFQLEADNSEN